MEVSPHVIMSLLCLIFLFFFVVIFFFCVIFFSGSYYLPHTSSAPLGCMRRHPVFIRFFMTDQTERRIMYFPSFFHMFHFFFLASNGDIFTSRFAERGKMCSVESKKGLLKWARH